MEAPAHKTRVIFRYLSREVLQPTEEIRVVGSSEELGNWQPESGIRLSLDGCWVSNPVAFPLNKVVEYKYAICDSKTGRLREWEARARNHWIRPTGWDYVVEDDDGSGRREDELYNRSRSETQEELFNSPKTNKLQQFEEQLIKQKSLEVADKDFILCLFQQLPITVEREEGPDGTQWKVVQTNVFFAKELLTTAQEEGWGLRIVGQLDVHVEDLQDRKDIKEILAKHGCIPVFVDKKVSAQHLDISNKVLWPAMHSSKVSDSVDGVGSEGFSEQKWRSYQTVCKAFVEVVLEAFECSTAPSRLVWIHDFYLLLAPRYLSLRCPKLSIGFMLHCAFPSLEVLRCLPTREEVLRSMLSCNVVTFQIFDYVSNFLECCQSLLKTTHSFQTGGILQIEFDDRSIVVRADHVVLPYSRLVQQLDNPAIAEQAMAIRNQYRGKTIFGSIDRDEPFSGMALKLRAFHKFLTDRPWHRKSIVLLQYVLPSTQDPQEEDKKGVLPQIRRLAADVNKDFGEISEVVKISVGSLSVHEQLATLQAFDVLLDTSINDGLNLFPFMFYAAHSKDSKGLVICSECCGCSSVLTGALHVNPWNTKGVMDSMDTVLTMEESLKADRFAKDLSYTSEMTLQEWVKENIVEMKNLQKAYDGPIKGLDDGFRMHFMKHGYRHVETGAVLHAYRTAKTRAFFLDYGGTLVPDRRASGATLAEMLSPSEPSAPILEALEVLAKDRNNIVVIASGHTQSVMEKMFGQIEGICLCAEYGFYWRVPKTTNGDWTCLKGHAEEDDDWKNVTIEVMKLYVKRMQQTRIDIKGGSIAWIYHEVQAQEIAKEVALELAKYLDGDSPQGILYGYPVTVVAGKGYVEVKRRDVNKGLALTRVLEEMGMSLQLVNFCLCLGNNIEDEDMFGTVNMLGAKGLAMSSGGESDGGAASDTASPRYMKKRGSGPAKHKCLLRSERSSERRRSHESVEGPDDLRRGFFTVVVGRKPSKAKYYLKDTDEVSHLLTELARICVQTRIARFSSVPELNCLAPNSDKEVDDSDSQPEITMMTREESGSMVYL